MIPRGEVTRFATEMETVLRENDYKDPYTDCSIEWLFERLEAEVEELRIAIKERTNDDGDKELNVRKECVDVANFAMFIFENRREEENEPSA